MYKILLILSSNSCNSCNSCNSLFLLLMFTYIQVLGEGLGQPIAVLL